MTNVNGVTTLIRGEGRPASFPARPALLDALKRESWNCKSSIGARRQFQAASGPTLPEIAPVRHLFYDCRHGKMPRYRRTIAQAFYIDRQIDQLVYEFYSLSAEEIRIVEEATK